MKTPNDITLTKQPCPLTQMLVELGRPLLKSSRNAEWLDIDEICSMCKERSLTLNGKLPNAADLESELRRLFESTDELCVEGMSITGYYRRVGWDLVFVVRFFPDVKSSNISFGNHPHQPFETEPLDRSHVVDGGSCSMSTSLSL